MIPILIILIILAAAGYLYNRTIRFRNLLAEAASGVDVQLKLRSELVPNLVAVVKAYKLHEAETLEKTTAARSSVSIYKDTAGQSAAEKTIGTKIKQLLVLAEAYPDLKASQNFLDLQNQLAQIEDQLQYARRYYNGSVRNYNIQIETFPGNLLAKLFKFQSAAFFELEYATERKTPDVNF